MTTTFTVLLLAVAAAAAMPAQSQSVWRCGADARTYSDRPCNDGSAMQTAALADPRDAGQRRAAQQLAAKERTLADDLRNERLQREAAAAALARADAVAHLRQSRANAAISRSSKTNRQPAAAAAGTSRATARATRRAPG